jgi:hypothetical protein
MICLALAAATGKPTVLEDLVIVWREMFCLYHLAKHYNVMQMALRISKFTN